jgi:hypothetical protein
MTLDYTKWHATQDFEVTLCGKLIPLALEGTFVPETEWLEKVDCYTCKGSRAYYAEMERNKIIQPRGE